MWARSRCNMYSTTLRNGTSISEASKRVPIFSFATHGGKQVSSYFRQGNWVQARDAQIRFPLSSHGSKPPHQPVSTDGGVVTKQPKQLVCRAEVAHCEEADTQKHKSHRRTHAQPQIQPHMHVATHVTTGTGLDYSAFIIFNICLMHRTLCCDHVDAPNIHLVRSQCEQC
jgi:hypothetical protein